MAALLTTRELLSGLTGSVSLAAWIFLLVPQLLENYTKQSAEGVSLAFLCVWFLGDVTNLIGSVWAGLVPTVIALAVYFCIADSILITQCLYYNHLNTRSSRNELGEEDRSSNGDTNSPEQPLLGRRESRSSVGSRRSRRSSVGSHGYRSSSLFSSRSSGSSKRACLVSTAKNIGGVVGVTAGGAVGWYVAWKLGAWQPQDDAPDGSIPVAMGAELFGYFSAVCYLCARIPQIIKNFRDKSCEGLSLLFFILSLLGNLTYGFSILFHSTEPEYVKVNIPWLLGSLGTMVEDAVIFGQFYMYSSSSATTTT